MKKHKAVRKDKQKVKWAFLKKLFKGKNIEQISEHELHSLHKPVEQ